MKILRWIQGNTRKYHIRNVIVRGKTHVKQINNFLVKKRLSRFGHVRRRDDNVSAKYSNRSIPSKRKNQAEVDGLRKRRHDAKYDTPRLDIRRRELVRNDTKRQPYPGNDGKVTKGINCMFELACTAMQCAVFLCSMETVEFKS